MDFIKGRSVVFNSGECGGSRKHGVLIKGTFMVCERNLLTYTTMITRYMTGNVGGQISFSVLVLNQCRGRG